jgi:hypothetical protein
MAKYMKYLEKALIVVLDDDKHGRLGFSSDHIRSIKVRRHPSRFRY